MCVCVGGGTRENTIDPRGVGVNYGKQRSNMVVDAKLCCSKRSFRRCIYPGGEERTYTYTYTYTFTPNLEVINIHTFSLLHR